MTRVRGKEFRLARTLPPFFKPSNTHTVLKVPFLVVGVNKTYHLATRLAFNSAFVSLWATTEKAAGLGLPGKYEGSRTIIKSAHNTVCDCGVATSAQREVVVRRRTCLQTAAPAPLDVSVRLRPTHGETVNPHLQVLWPCCVDRVSKRRRNVRRNFGASVAVPGPLIRRQPSQVVVCESTVRKLDASPVRVDRQPSVRNIPCTPAATVGLDGPCSTACFAREHTPKSPPPHSYVTQEPTRTNQPTNPSSQH
ncbi:hypothetical protein Bbelb_124760 [Branchiostoma belcheri]|nr:hypothetical protein Bbelb_124760 [Branchiostoma belcheri]